MLEPNSEGLNRLGWNRVFQAEKIAVQRCCAAGRKLGDGGRWKHEASRAQSANENIQED